MHKCCLFWLSRDKVLVEPGTGISISVWFGRCCFLACVRLSMLLSSREPEGSQGELIVYPWYGVRRRCLSVDNFKRLHLWNSLTNQSQISCGGLLDSIHARIERRVFKYIFIYICSLDIIHMSYSWEFAKQMFATSCWFKTRLMLFSY